MQGLGRVARSNLKLEGIHDVARIDAGVVAEQVGVKGLPPFQD